MCLLAEKRNNKQAAFHQHFLLFGQSVGEHFHFVFVTGFIYFEHKLFECRHVFGQRSNDFRNVFAPAHDNKFQLAQMVVGRGFEGRADDSFKNLAAYFAVRKIAVCAAFI